MLEIIVFIIVLVAIVGFLYYYCVKTENESPNKPQPTNDVFYTGTAPRQPEATTSQMPLRYHYVDQSDLQPICLNSIRTNSSRSIDEDHQHNSTVCATIELHDTNSSSSNRTMHQSSSVLRPPYPLSNPHPSTGTNSSHSIDEDHQYTTELHDTNPSSSNRAMHQSSSVLRPPYPLSNPHPPTGDFMPPPSYEEAMAEHSSSTHRF